METDIFMKTLEYPDLAEYGSVCLQSQHLEAEAGGSWVRGSPRLHDKTYFKQTKRNVHVCLTYAVETDCICVTPVPAVSDRWIEKGSLKDVS